MRIAHVFKDFWPPLAAGITRYIADVADAATQRGHDVEVHVAGVPRSRRDVLSNGVVVHRHREFGRLLSSPLSPGLVRGSRGLSADVVHLHLPNPVGELGCVSFPSTTRLVVSFHARLGRQRLLAPLYRPLQRRVLDQSSTVLVSSETMALAPELLGYSSKLRVVPYGVSPRLAPAEVDRVHHRPPPLQVLFVGRLVYYKGVDVLLRAMAQLAGVRLTVVGEGPLRSRLESLAVTLGICGSVEFQGQITDDELRQRYLASDVFVLPSVSRAEAFGLAAIEAMAAGLPPVTTSLGTGTDWINTNGVTGLVVPPGDIGALAAAIEAMKVAEERRRLGTAARARAMSTFPFSGHCDALFDAYDGR